MPHEIASIAVRPSVSVERLAADIAGGRSAEIVDARQPDHMSRAHALKPSAG